MKATKQYLPALLLIMLLKLFLLFEFLVVTTTMKAITQNFPVVLFTVLCKVVLTFGYLNENDKMKPLK